MFPFLILCDGPEKAAAIGTSPKYQSGASKSLSRVWIRGRVKTLSWGTLDPCLWASAQETPAARRLASPGKRTRRGRRVRAVVSQLPVPWQPMTGVRRTQDSPQTEPDGCNQAPQPGFLNELRVENIVVSY